MRRLLFLLAKVAVSSLLLYFSLRLAHIEAIGVRLAASKSAFLAIAVTLFIAQLTLLAVRWLEIDRAGSASLTIRTALKFTFIGAFFSQVLPSTIGGDAARIVLLGRRGGWRAATYSVLIDRILGITALAALVIACLPWTWALVESPPTRLVFLLLGLGAITGAALFLTIGFAPAWIVGKSGPARHLVVASHMAWRLCGWPKSSLVLAATTFLSHLLSIALVWSCAKALAVPVGFGAILCLLPPVLLVSAAPISINGWGVREATMTTAFGYAGLSGADGLTLSILYGLVSFAASAIGAVVWIASESGKPLSVGLPETLSVTEEATP